MAESNESQRQRDEELSGHFPEAVRTFIKTALIDVHTCMPGIVKDFDSGTLTVAVQPAVKRKFVHEGFKDLPLCMQVPVQFPRAGNFILTFPVQDGDEVLLCFGERSIDNWWQEGGVQEPAAIRMHNLSDAFALLGFSSKPKASQVASVSGDACELRTLDGAVVVRVENNKVVLGATLGAHYAADGENLFAYLTTLATSLAKPGPLNTGPASILATMVKVK